MPTQQSEAEPLLEQLLELGEKQFSSEHIFDEVPHAFVDRNQYVNWRITLADLLHVDPGEIVLVGSAALGFSLNPHKGFRPFTDDSDIDVAVISQRHFEEAWHYMRHMPSAKRGRMGAAARRALDEHRERHIYFGVVATDRIIQYLPFAQEWLTALSFMAGVEPTLEREINARIYRDFHALRSYQVLALRQAKNQYLTKLSKGA